MSETCPKDGGIIMKQSINNLFVLIIYAMCFTIIPLNIIKGQSQPEQISLPTENQFQHGGAMTVDLINANGFIFLYTLEKVMVYNTNNVYCGNIYFPEQLTEEVEYGKFNPVFYNSRLHTGSYSLMTFNDNANILYIVTPSLNILYLNIDYPSNHLFSNTDIIGSYNPFEDPQISELDGPSFKPLNGLNIIKYDHINEGLYWLVYGQNDEDNDIGSFHKKKRLLAIFNVNYNGSLTHYWSEVMAAADGNYEEANISDIVYNTSNADYFYLAKLNQIEIRKFSDPGTVIYEYIIDASTYFATNPPGAYPYYKFSKLGYINNGSVHKIMAIPYRIPFALPLPDKQSDIFVIDGNHDDLTINPSQWFTSLPSPTHRVLDGEFLEANNDFIISYAPDQNEVIYHSTYQFDHDIAVYHYNSGFEEPTIMQTNYSIPTHEFDINASLKLLKVDNSNIIISKKDELVRLIFSNNEYSTSQLLNAENNLFVKGVSSAGKSFIINPISNGLEAFSAQNYIHTSLKTGYPVYHITADSDGDKLYLFNKLNSHNSGLYVCDLDYNNNTQTVVNINDGVSNNNIESNIGDCIYNPYSNHFIVSEFSGSTAKIQILNNDDQNSLYTTISLPQGIHYPEKMFIAPNKRLYVLANMINEATVQPHIIVYAADNMPLYNIYEEIDNYSIYTSSTADFIYYSGNFCFNKYDQKVYATIHPKTITLDPYLTEHNSMYGEGLPFDVGTGDLFCVNDHNYSNHFTGLSRPMKLLSPDYAEISQYEGKLFVIGDGFYVYDYNEGTLSSDYEEIFNEIVYCPVNDMMYGMKDIAEDPSQLCDRTISIQEIYYNNSILNFGNIIAEYPGQASAMIYNRFDGNIYVYRKFDEYKKGGSQITLWRFNPTINPIGEDEINLRLKCTYPELDHNPDLHYFFYNLITPYINPFNNTIYVPNGGHSCVSKIPFEANEAVPLQEGVWSWISFPRMNRVFNSPLSIPLVLGGNNIEPNNYTTDSKLQNLIIGSNTNIEESFYDENLGWNSGGDLIETQSTLGYKLFLDYTTQPENKWLYMQGSLYDHFDPNCTNCPLTLTGTANEYWVGYYHPISQNIPDALPDEYESQIDIVKGQYFTCYNEENQTDGIIWRCVCNKGTPTLDYGDMVIITPKSGTVISNFYWAYYNNLPTDITKDETEYYSYTETADYTPIFIELDTNENPQEIGAFVNDSCIGGTTVFPNDSVVLIAAYTDSLSGQIYFESYYANNKSYSPLIKDYYVENRQTNIKEKRTIHTKEKHDYYIISFSNVEDDGQLSELFEARVQVFPNPLNNVGTVSFYIASADFVEVVLFDVFGNEQVVLHKGILHAGEHQLSIADNPKVQKLSNGTYIVSLRASTYQVQTKLVVIR